MSAREEVLRRVRTALADVPPGDGRPPLPRVPGPGGGGSALDHQTAVDLFCSRVGDYRATVTRAEGEGLAAAITERCRANGVSRLAVPPALAESWRPDGVELVADHDLSPAELDRVDGALTGCALAIAETGTLVLDGGPRSGRRALTLVPDLHLCVVEAGQVVADVPEAIARLEPVARELRRPVTLVSGPSATSDIELSRVEGVHGPRTLEVLVVAP